MTGGLAACSKDDGPEPALKRFLDGWAKGDVAEVPVILPNGERVQPTAINDEIKTLSGTLYETKPQLSVSKIDEKDGLATSEVFVSQPLPGGLKWEYPTSVKLSKAKDGWQVIWEPTVIHPKLNRGERIETRRLAQTRGNVLGAGGEELVKPRPVVIVGIHPQRVVGPKDRFVAQLRDGLAPVYQLTDTAALTAQISDPANMDKFIEVVPLRRELYDQVRAVVQPMVGTQFREEQRMLAESAGFARPVLGTVGAVTKEIMDANPGVYQPTDVVGQGGLQQRHDGQLRGTTGVKVVTTRKAADGTTQESAVLHTIDPKAGQPIKTTLDSKTQRAAEAALARFPQNSALVAIRVSDGAIVAAANKANYNMAFTAQVPPGSTFKAVTTIGLLDNGKVTPTQVVQCPRELVVAGRPPIHNSGMFSLSNPTFTEDFYRSCNTAFASLAPQLGSDGLIKAGASVGLGQTWDLGLEVSSGKVSQGGSEAELAAASFGQGTTVVSPVAMAGVAAAIARGQWKQPQLVLDPAPAKPAADGPAIKPSTVDPLREMMKLVVTTGTADSLKHHTTLHGKTGTAEYVTGDPSKTHAWFIGWSGDLAFAVFVEQGGSPKDTALPITDSFLKAL